MVFLRLYNGLAVFSLIYYVIQYSVLCEETQTHAEDSLGDEKSYLPEDKRQHNIMRFGKRPSSLGHSLIRFGKRLEETNPKHSYLYFGKRGDVGSRSNLPELLRYLQKSQESSWKRGHNIMRFGKRADNHHFIRFGKNDQMYTEGSDPAFDPNLENIGPDSQDKRNTHSMMYFGKRNGHNMLYFGKRDGHSMLYFGKRQDSVKDYPGQDDLYEENKRSPHSMIHFGKRGEVSEESILNSEEDKRAHSMIHFGKRESDDNDHFENYDDKRAHSMIHFGKRELPIDETAMLDADGESTLLDDQDKRGTHSMIHFGKRDEEQNEGEPENLSQWIHTSGPLGISAKRYHTLLRFGKRFMNEEASTRNGGGHSMIHFGKREDDKRAHSMIHFGKRSVQETAPVAPKGKNESLSAESVKEEQNPNGKHGLRLKRQVNSEDMPTVSLIHYIPEFSEIERQNYDRNEHPAGHQFFLADKALPMEDRDNIPEFQVEEVPLFITRKVRSDWRAMISPDKRENSRNVFLRFGKR